MGSTKLLSISSFRANSYTIYLTEHLVLLYYCLLVRARNLRQINRPKINRATIIDGSNTIGLVFKNCNVSTETRANKLKIKLKIDDALALSLCEDIANADELINTNGKPVNTI